MHPHTVFIVGLALVGPLLAMLGMSIGGMWQPAGVGAGSAVVAAAAWRSTMHSYHDQRMYPFFRWRMMAVTGIVAAAATVLLGGSVVWLVLAIRG
jgi:hypothetical protein